MTTCRHVVQATDQMGIQNVCCPAPYTIDICGVCGGTGDCPQLIQITLITEVTTSRRRSLLAETAADVIAQVKAAVSAELGYPESAIAVTAERSADSTGWEVCVYTSIAASCAHQSALSSHRAHIAWHSSVPATCSTCYACCMGTSHTCCDTLRFSVLAAQQSSTTFMHFSVRAPWNMACETPCHLACRSQSS